jgi:hypothetical protein
MVLISEIKNGNETVAIFPLPPKNFKTGSRGFYANGKAEIEGKRYQVQIQLVEIGSKKQEEVKPDVAE